MRAATELEPMFVRVREAAAFLAVPEWRMYELLRKQLIESRYEGKRRLVLVSSLREFAEKLPDERPTPVTQ